MKNQEIHEIRQEYDSYRYANNKNDLGSKNRFLNEELAVKEERIMRLEDDLRMRNEDYSQKIS